MVVRDLVAIYPYHLGRREYTSFEAAKYSNSSQIGQILVGWSRGGALSVTKGMAVVGCKVDLWGADIGLILGLTDFHASSDGNH
jgi:hypothetical protein